MTPIITSDEMIINFPEECLIKFYEKYFYRKNLLDETTGEILKDTSILNLGRILNKPLGIKLIEYNRTRGEVKLYITSKCLKQDYKKHISFETLDDVLNSVNESGFIEINPSLVKKTAKVTSLDLTRDISTSKPISNYLRDLRILGTQGNFRIKNFKTGLEVYSEARSNNQRMVIYDKYEELSTKKVAKTELLKYVDKNDFKGKLRIEANLRYPVLIRKYFEINSDEDIMLSSIFEHKENVLVNYFNYMWPKLKIDKTFADSWFSTRSPTETAKQIGERYIIEMCRFDRSNIRAYLKSLLLGKKNPSYYMAHYDKILVMMKAEELGRTVDAETIEELRTKLAEV